HPTVFWRHIPRHLCCLKTHGFIACITIGEYGEGQFTDIALQQLHIVVASRSSDLHHTLVLQRLIVLANRRGCPAHLLPGHKLSDECSRHPDPPFLRAPRGHAVGEASDKSLGHVEGVVVEWVSKLRESPGSSHKQR